MLRTALLTFALCAHAGSGLSADPSLGVRYVSPNLVVESGSRRGQLTLTGAQDVEAFVVPLTSDGGELGVWVRVQRWDLSTTSEEGWLVRLSSTGDPRVQVLWRGWVSEGRIGVGGTRAMPYLLDIDGDERHELVLRHFRWAAQADGNPGAQEEFGLEVVGGREFETLPTPAGLVAANLEAWDASGVVADAGGEPIAMQCHIAITEPRAGLRAVGNDVACLVLRPQEGSGSQLELLVARVHGPRPQVVARRSIGTGIAKERSCLLPGYPAFDVSTAPLEQGGVGRAITATWQSDSESLVGQVYSWDGRALNPISALIPLQDCRSTEPMREIVVSPAEAGHQPTISTRRAPIPVE